MLGEPEANSLILGCWGALRDARFFNPSACLHKDVFDFHQYGDVWFLILNKKDLLWVNVSLNQRGATASHSYPGFPWDFMRSEIGVPEVSRQPKQMLFKGIIYRCTITYLYIWLIWSYHTFPFFHMDPLVRLHTFLQPFPTSLSHVFPFFLHLHEMHIKRGYENPTVDQVDFMQVLIFKIPITARISHLVLNWWINSDGNHLYVER